LKRVIVMTLGGYLLLATVAVPPPTLAAWSAPVDITTSNEDPVAHGAFGGSVWFGAFERAVSVAMRSGDGFSVPTQITRSDPFEEVQDAGFADNGDGVVLTVRRHRPVRRIRATLVIAHRGRIAPRTISGTRRSASQPRLSVATDGTAVAAWQNTTRTAGACGPRFVGPRSCASGPRRRFPRRRPAPAGRGFMWPRAQAAVRC
jgi:hypothetical protein